MRGSSREKLYQELGLETLQRRRCHIKLCYFYEILKSQSPKFLCSITPIHNAIKLVVNVKHNAFQNTLSGIN